MPSPMKMRMKSAIGLAATDAVDFACGATGFTGVPELTAAAGLTVLAADDVSRRVTASAVHINGAMPGSSPVAPDANHDSRFAPASATEPERAAVSAGAGAGAGADWTDCAAGAEVTREPPGAEGSDCWESEAGATTGAAGVSGAERAGVSATGGEATAGLECCSTSGVLGEVAAPADRRCDGALEPASVAGVGAGSLLPARGPRPPRPDLVDGVEGSPEDTAGPPEEPSDPDVSAKATGREDRPDPMPKATARAPTRPTY